jgi:hypothetical protein
MYESKCSLCCLILNLHRKAITDTEQFDFSPDFIRQIKNKSGAISRICSTHREIMSAEFQLKNFGVRQHKGYVGLSLVGERQI